MQYPQAGVCVTVRRRLMVGLVEGEPGPLQASLKGVLVGRPPAMDGVEQISLAIEDVPGGQVLVALAAACESPTPVALLGMLGIAQAVRQQIQE